MVGLRLGRDRRHGLPHDGCGFLGTPARRARGSFKWDAAALKCDNPDAERAGTQGLAFLTARETVFLARALGDTTLERKAQGMADALAKLRPDLGDLAWAEGAFALPTGEKVAVRVRRTDSGAPEVEVDHPPWVTVE